MEIFIDRSCFGALVARTMLWKPSCSNPAGTQGHPPNTQERPEAQRDLRRKIWRDVHAFLSKVVWLGVFTIPMHQYCKARIGVQARQHRPLREAARTPIVQTLFKKHSLGCCITHILQIVTPVGAGASPSRTEHKWELTTREAWNRLKQIPLQTTTRIACIHNVC